jgi:predicted nucleic acid-binding protein
MANFVLDTSAILAAFRGEPGNEEVRRVLRAAEASGDTTIYVPFVALMEVEYQFLREMSEDDTEYWLNVALNWPIRVLESTPEWRHKAAQVKAPGKVSLADAWVAALALDLDAELVHKDPEFDRVDGLKALRLPYDRDAGGGT